MLNVKNTKNLFIINKIDEFTYNIISNEDILLKPYEYRMVNTGLFFSLNNEHLYKSILPNNDLNNSYIVLFGENKKYEEYLEKDINIENLMYIYNITESDIIIPKNTIMGEIYLTLNIYSKDNLKQYNEPKTNIYSNKNIEILQTKPNTVDRVEYSENSNNEKMLIIYLKE